MPYVPAGSLVATNVSNEGEDTDGARTELVPPLHPGVPLRRVWGSKVFFAATSAAIEPERQVGIDTGDGRCICKVNPSTGRSADNPGRLQPYMHYREFLRHDLCGINYIPCLAHCQRRSLVAARKRETIGDLVPTKRVFGLMYGLHGFSSAVNCGRRLVHHCHVRRIIARLPR